MTPQAEPRDVFFETQKLHVATMTFHIGTDRVERLAEPRFERTGCRSWIKSSPRTAASLTKRS